MRVLNSSRLAFGPMLEQFESEMAAFCGVKHAVAVNSGTSALHLIVKSLNLGAGDEVITTPFSFVASSNCLLFEDALPKFVDIDPATLSFGHGSTGSNHIARHKGDSGCRCLWLASPLAGASTPGKQTQPLPHRRRLRGTGCTDCRQAHWGVGKCGSFRVLPEQTK